MLQILLHSSKTMRRSHVAHAPLGRPQFEAQAATLMAVLQDNLELLGDMMKISAAKAVEVRQMCRVWPLAPDTAIPAIDAFQGDIYSGLQVQSWTDADRAYAHRHLLILSGLYGALRACDGIAPYRLEMGYKLPTGVSMYQFWGSQLATAIPPATTQLINLSSVEYTRALLPYVDLPIITPKFLTISPKTGEPAFVTVHAKVARGAFARWLIVKRIDDTAKLTEFTDLGYAYDASLSTLGQPVFVCKEFGGLGMSVRLT